MRRALRVALAALLLVAAFEAGRLAGPDVSFACRCAAQRPIIEYVDEPGSVVAVGDIGRIGAEGDAPFIVRQVIFGGPILIPQVVIDPHEAGICNPSLVAGQRVVFVGSFAEGVIRPRACAPFHQLASPAGQRLLAEAVAVFGGAGDGEDPPDGGFIGTTLTILGGLLAGVLLLFGAIVILAKRGRAPA